MLDVVLDTLVDGVKLLPFLFLTYLAMEYIEHKTTAKTKNTIKKSGKLGPLVGGILGAFPQCGFSTAGSNLYAGRVITLGTLISIYLSTSDEMLPVFLSEKVPMTTILSMIAVKAVIGMVAGFIIDFVIRIRKSSQEQDFTSKIGHMCDHDHCHCDKSIVKSALNHTLTIFAFILVISFLLNTAVFFVGEDSIAGIILDRPVLGSILSGIVGLIPNCAASVVITQLYVEGVISIGATMSGLLVGAGAGLIVLFKENRDIKENIKIVALLYAIGVACGIIIDFIL
ncbi:MAG: putative manganese transporter [Lachnospira sp.]|nr:putative manganese transporter [Lachnospira sp.]